MIWVLLIILIFQYIIVGYKNYKIKKLERKIYLYEEKGYNINDDIIKTSSHYSQVCTEITESFLSLADKQTNPNDINILLGMATGADKCAQVIKKMGQQEKPQPNLMDLILSM